MWLTGFDAPCVHTMYIDKPMQGHGLMQAIARVNRVYKDKPTGLVVDYIGVAEQLKRAVGVYSGHGDDPPGVPVEEALALLEKEFDVVRAMFHGFDSSGYHSRDPGERLTALQAGANHLFGLEDGKKRFLDAMTALNRAVAIAQHLEEARRYRDDVAFCQAVERNVRKHTVMAAGIGRRAVPGVWSISLARPAWPSPNCRYYAGTGPWLRDWRVCGRGSGRAHRWARLVACGGVRSPFLFGVALTCGAPLAPGPSRQSRRAGACHDGCAGGLRQPQTGRTRFHAHRRIPPIPRAHRSSRPHRAPHRGA